MSEWQNVQKIPTKQWRCGFCDREVASDRGWVATEYNIHADGNVVTGSVVLCPRCDGPSMISSGGMIVPPPGFGKPIEHLSTDVKALYDEARKAVAAGAPNSAALACRKILMHVAVEKDAPEGENFVTYVNYLSEKGLVPPDAREWVDEIRELGNDANHEIELISPEEAKDIVEFTEMLLRVVYEYPERGRRARADRQSRRP